MTKPIPEARALSESALLDLASALQEASTPVAFLASADAIIVKPDNLLPLPVSLGVPDTLNVEGSRAKDIDNAPRVHDYLGEIDRANASDARLWTYLAFGTYRDYMEKRWPLVDAGNWKGRVKDRWLLPNGFVTRGRLVRHGIARLWWVSHLTFTLGAEDGIAKDDPYAYTKEVFRREDRLNAIFDREVGAFPTVMKAVLDHAASLGARASDKYLQRVMQYLTLISGYRDVGMLDIAGLRELVEIAALRASAEGNS
ncbi:DUF6339 family protein [Spongiibacter sp. UBA1325]|jgi:hypothetical protein|uniref:DUF6339 family protein n=1 Tax=Spongiibacter sp. UBA1325 TaxID=1947543 RepID=UPI002580F939|nr:DUF6339 family protein [Spongiibacter sp. UBA1325]|tara:strand:- start:2588 stop:3355 length:768 start_codon:yes stop_codon:yes gene_type:complete